MYVGLVVQTKFTWFQSYHILLYILRQYELEISKELLMVIAIYRWELRVDAWNGRCRIPGTIMAICLLVDKADSPASTSNTDFGVTKR